MIIELQMSEYMSNDAKYCSQCQEEQEVVQTVSWQPDICKVCGTPIDSD